MIQSPIYFSVSVDIYRPAPQPIVNAQQGDSGRGLSITLWADGNLLNPTTEVITLYAQKPDGTVSYLPCTVSDGNILCVFTNQMLAIPGDVRIQLQITLTDTAITSTVCIVNVLESIIDQGAIESTNEFTALEQSLMEVEELKKNGLKGDPGESATIKVGKVEASPSGSAPSVTNSGTPQNAVFDFVLPRGEQGERGEPGKQDLFFGARSTFPQTGDASILYIDNTVTPAVQYIWKGSEYVLAGGGSSDVTAENVSYDNASSGLAANTVQGAIDENAADIKAINSNIGNLLTTVKAKTPSAASSLEKVASYPPGFDKTNTILVGYNFAGSNGSERMLNYTSVDIISGRDDGIYMRVTNANVVNRDLYLLLARIQV